MMLGRTFVVATHRRWPVIQPKGPFHRQSSGQSLEPAEVIGSLHDGHRDRDGGLGPLLQAAKCCKSDDSVLLARTAGVRRRHSHPAIDVPPRRRVASSR